jgi:hypothetical protein
MVVHIPTIAGIFAARPGALAMVALSSPCQAEKVGARAEGGHRRGPGLISILPQQREQAGLPVGYMETTVHRQNDSIDKDGVPHLREMRSHPPLPPA